VFTCQRVCMALAAPCFYAYCIMRILLLLIFSWPVQNSHLLKHNRLTRFVLLQLVGQCFRITRKKISGAYKLTCTLVHFTSTIVRVWDVVPTLLCNTILGVHSGRICSLEISWTFKCAGESHWTSWPHRGDLLDYIMHVLIHLLFCRESYVA
jgi:hypothetical protein